MALTGRAVLLALLGVIPIVLVPSWWTVLWTQLGWLAIVGLDAGLAGSPRKVRVLREPLGSVRLGEPAQARVLLTNEGRRRVRGVVRDAWQPSAGAASTRHRLDVPRGERRRVVTELRPTRRGDRYAGHVALRTLGPLGVAARQASIPAVGRIRVLPPFTSRKHLPSRLARLRELDGRTQVQIRGQGTEFDSLRDYVEGDDVRSIDWRATARRREVVVRTWRPERDRRVLIVLDTSRTSAGRVGEGIRLDAAMDAALLLAALASRAGDRVDLLAHDRRVSARVEGASRARLLPALVEAMAPLDPQLVEAEWTSLVAAVRTRLTRRALVVLLTPLETGAVREGLLPVLPLLTQRHQVVVASVSDPRISELAAGRGGIGEVYGAAAATRAQVDRDRLAASINRLGADVVDADPETLPPALADRYLALKAAGRL